MTPRRATWSASTSFANLFRWSRQHIVYTDPVTGDRVDRWEAREPLHFTNPFAVWSGMTWHATAVAVVAWMAAFVDSFDFNVLAISIVKMAAYYDVTKATMATSITLTMLFRMVGAAIWGIVGDYFGRRIALVTNLWFLALMQLASIYASSFPAFLATRALFGVGMGGILGCGASWSFESLPVAARGVYSGIFQTAYPVSYLVAAAINLAIGPGHWQTLFGVGGGLSFAVGVFRAFIPEEPRYLEARRTGHATKTFVHNFIQMVSVDWPVLVYISILVAWFLVHGHAIQDSYVTFLITSKGFNNSQASRNAIYAKLGAILGNLVIAFVSQSLGRRRTMMICLLVATTIIPAAVMPTSESSLAVGGFFLQAWAQSWSILPVYLSEICHPSWRALIVGLSYQVGAALSSPTTQVVNILGERYHANITKANGAVVRVEAYGPIMAIVTSIAAVVTVTILAFGPERLGSHFENAPVAAEDMSEASFEAKKASSTKGEGSDAGSGRNSIQTSDVGERNKEQQRDEQRA